MNSMTCASKNCVYLKPNKTFYTVIALVEETIKTLENKISY